MIIDLNNYKSGDWLRLRSGGLFRPAKVCRVASIEFPWTVDDLTYTSEGSYYGYGNSDSDITEIIPAERITLIEWITYRSPTKEDATDNHVLVKYDENDIQLWHWGMAMYSAKPWAHCPGWAPPAPPQPEVSDLEAENAALYGRLRDVDGANRGPVMSAELEFHRQQLIRQRRGKV